MKSDESFHMMRDHPMHDIGMLGSAWGVKLTKENIRLKWQKAWKNGFRDDEGLMWKARNLTGASSKLCLKITKKIILFI